MRCDNLCTCRSGAISGVQGSLQSLFQTLAFGVGIVVHRAEDFTWLMAGSCCIVAVAAGSFTAFVLRVGADGGKEQAPGFAALPSDDSAGVEMTKNSGTGVDI